MMRPVPVSEPALGAVEREALQRCIDDGWISSEGPQVAQFEERIAELVGRRHASRSAAARRRWTSPWRLSGVGPGDEVIVPSFTIISCVTQVVRAGATPVFVDAEPVTWNPDVPSNCSSRIGPRTRAIILPHLYGLPADIAPVEEVRASGIVLIEDAAEAHGQSYRGRPCGSFGAMSMLSFYPNKLITTGEGGMLLTDDDGLAERARRLRNLGFQPERRFVHEVLGWNYRMTNLQAALGVAQLERWDDARRAQARDRAALPRAPRRPRDDPARTRRACGETNLYWVVGLVVDEATGLDAITVMRGLAERGSGAGRSSIRSTASRS
jgi:perosamine synthetase